MGLGSGNQFLQPRWARAEGVRDRSKIRDRVPHAVVEAHPMAVGFAEGLLENREKTTGAG